MICPACNFTKINTPPWVFFTFFKLYKMVPNRTTHHKFQNLKMGKERTQNLNLTHTIKLRQIFSKRCNVFLKSNSMKYLTSFFVIFYEGAVGLAKFLSHLVCKSRNLEMGDRTILHLLFA